MSKTQEDKKSKFPPVLIALITLVICFAIALFIRVYLPYDKIFVGEWIKFSGTDVYYHMRLVDIMAHNFPHLSNFDPYLVYPGGASMGTHHFFRWLLASIVWVVGLGKPTQHTIDVVGVYLPAVLGALTVIPVYFIGKELFGRWVGVLSTVLISVLPGEFLGRSLLSFTDHDVANTLFTTVTVLFVVLAVKAAKQRQLSFGSLMRRDWSALIKPAVYSLLAGVFLGIYLLTWAGGLLFVFIIFIFFVIQSIIDHLRGNSADYLGLIGVIIFLVVLVMLLPTRPGVLERASLPLALLIPLALGGISWLMVKKKVKPVYYPLTIIVLGLAGVGVFYVISPSLFRSVLDAFNIFVPTATSMTTIEMQPILFPSGVFSFAVVWGNFTTSFFFGLISLCILIYLVIKRDSADKTLFLVWSLAIFLATMGQRRFAAYFAVNAALLTGYLSWRMLGLVGFKELSGEADKAIKETGSKSKRARPQKGGFRITVSQVNMALAVLILFLIVYAPNFLFPKPDLSPTIATAKQVRWVPSNAWVSSLVWMRENTPDPFGNPDFYYHLETRGIYGALSDLMRLFPNTTGDPDFYYHLEESYPYPESAYGVMSWWDYGYWITRIARRIPNANPGQDPRAVADVASFFVSQNESSASADMEKLGSKYVILDYETALGKFGAIIVRAGERQADFFDVYLVPRESGFQSQFFIYPEYYRSFAARLYNFDGKAVTPEKTVVISYEQGVGEKGEPLKVITGAKEFDNYEEAEAYLASQESDNYRIVGTSPLVSPVPLEALEHYELIHASEEAVTLPIVGESPAVKIFEYKNYVPAYK